MAKCKWCGKRVGKDAVGLVDKGQWCSWKCMSDYNAYNKINKALQFNGRKF